MAKLINNEAWEGSVELTEPSKTFTFQTGNRFVHKDIELTVSADIIAKVTSVPSEKLTSIILDTTTDKYYLWRAN